MWIGLWTAMKIKSSTPLLLRMPGDQPDWYGSLAGSARRRRPPRTTLCGLQARARGRADVVAPRVRLAPEGVARVGHREQRGERRHVLQLVDRADDVRGAKWLFVGAWHWPAAEFRRPVVPRVGRAGQRLKDSARPPYA